MKTVGADPGLEGAWPFQEWDFFPSGCRRACLPSSLYREVDGD